MIPKILETFLFVAGIEKFVSQLGQTLKEPIDEEWPENSRTMRDAVNF
jgi:hypothetical protein